MEARFVGTHQGESRDLRFTTIVIDGRLAIDAGSLASGLSLDEQLAIENVLLTHRHWDHIKDMPGFGFNLFSFVAAGGRHRSVDVWCGDDTRVALGEFLLNPAYWMDFFREPDPTSPVFRHRLVSPGAPFPVGGYQVEAIPVSHGTVTTGYRVTDDSGRTFYYTSDNGPGSGAQWALAKPDLLVTECTFSNAQCGLDGGRMHGHLCPAQIQVELESFRAIRGYVPRVSVIHVNPFHEDAIRTELADVARSTGASIVVAREDDRALV